LSKSLAASYVMRKFTKKILITLVFLLPYIQPSILKVQLFHKKCYEWDKTVWRLMPLFTFIQVYYIIL